MTRPTGLISDIPSADDVSVGYLIGTDANQCENSTLIDHFRFDLDQWPNQTCVPFALANGVWAAQGIAGLYPEDRVLLSPPALYYATLRRTHGSLAVLVDMGCKPSQCVAALNEIGCCMWDDWPHDRGDAYKCVTEPPGNLLMRGTDTDWVQMYRLDGWGLDRKRQIIGCLCADIPKPVICGLTLDKPYEDLKDDIWPGRTGPVIGRHMVALCGHDKNGPFVATTWGPDWAVGGVGQISWDAVMSLETTDVIAISVDITKMPKVPDMGRAA
jgi:hypothetical protein